MLHILTHKQAGFQIVKWFLVVSNVWNSLIEKKIAQDKIQLN